MAPRETIVISKKLALLNSASTVGAQFINFFVLLWVYQYLLRRLTAEEFAVLPVVTSLMVFAPLFFSFLTGGIARYVIDAYARSEFDEVRRIVSSLFPVILGATLVIYPFGLLFALNIEDFFNFAPEMVGDARLMFALLLTSFASQMLIFPFKTGFQVKQRYFEQSMLEVTRDFLRAFLVVWLLVFFGPSVLYVVIATFISETLLSVVFFVRARQLVPELKVDFRLFDFAKARELINFGIWTTVGRLGALLFMNAGTLVLNLFGTAVDVTSYHIGATFYRKMQSTISLATIPLQPAIIAMNASGDTPRLAKTVMRGGRYALWLSMMAATPLMIYSGDFIRLYLDQDYGQAATVIILMMILLPFIHPTILLPLTAIAQGKVREFFLPAFLFPAAGLIPMLIFVQFFDLGAIGVAMSLVLTTVVCQAGYFFNLLVKMVESDMATFFRQVLIPGLAPALIASVVWAGLKLAAPPDSWAKLIAWGAIGACVYVAVLLKFFLNPNERKDLRAVIKRKTGA